MSITSRSLIVVLIALAGPIAAVHARGFGGFHGGGFGGFGGAGAAGFASRGFGGSGLSGFSRGGDFMGSGGGFGGGGGFNGGGFNRPGGFSGGFGGADRFSNSGGFGGGGFNREAGGFGGGGFGNDGFRNGGFGNAGGFGSGGFGGGNSFENRLGQGGERPFDSAAGRFNGGGLDRQFGGEGNFGNRFNDPSRGDLNNFLGLPSDEGLHSLGGNRGNLGGNAGDNFNVQKGSVEGPRGGEAAGIAVTGPRGNTAARGAAVGPNGGVVAGRGVEGAGGAKAGQAIGVGPNGRVAGGSAVRGPNGYGGGRGFVAGPNGVAAGFSRVTPSGRYTTAAAVRGNYHNWGVYGRGWYTDHPGAWFAAGWAAGSAWNWCNWGSIWPWFGYAGYDSYAPIYYDYGTNVTYNDGSVYVNNQPVGTSEEYYQQAANYASAGQQDVSSDGDWLPLGVFALTRDESQHATGTLQLAVNKQGIIRGNYTDSLASQPLTVKGSVDKKTQRVCFTIGDDQTNIVETGLYNLTKDEAPALVHLGKDRTQQWLLVRLKQPEGQDASNTQS